MSSRRAPSGPRDYQNAGLSFNAMRSQSINDEESKKTDIVAVKWNTIGSKLAYSRTSKSLLICELAPPNKTSLGSPLIIRNCHSYSIQSISWNPAKDNILTTAGGDNLLKIWNCKTEKMILELNLPGKCNLVSYSSDGKYLGCVTQDSSNKSWHFLLYDNESSTIDLLDDKIFNEPISSLCWGNVDEVFVLGFSDGLVEFYQIDNELMEINSLFDLKASISWINTLSYDPSGKYLAVGGHEGIISLWNLHSLSCVKTIALIDEPVSSLMFSPDGKYLAATFLDGSTSRIYEVNSGKEVYEIRDCHSSEYNIAKVVFSNNNKFTYSTSKGEIFYT